MSAKKRFARNGLALSAALTVLAFGAPAVALDSPAPISGITKVTDGLAGPGQPANVRNATDTLSTVTMTQNNLTSQFNAQKMDVNTKNGTFKAYRVRPNEISAPLPKGNSLNMTELPLDKVGLTDQNGAQLESVLQQSKVAQLDNTPAGGLLKSAGVEPDAVTEKQRTAATQAAIWNLTSGAELSPERNDPVVTALYHQLLTVAKSSTVAQRKASPLGQVPLAGALPTKGQLPAPLQSIAGQVTGPFQVSTDSNPVGLNTNGSSNGAELVKPDGTPITKAAPGEPFYLKLADNRPAGDSVINTISEPREITGRIFAPVQDLKNNALIAESGSKLPVVTPYAVGYARSVKSGTSTTKPVANSNACPTGQKDCKPATAAEKSDKLAVTGTALTGFVVGGLVLLGGGAALFWLSRRRARLAEVK